jgi:hypothetical protein
LELDEPAGTAGKVAHDEQRPLVADEVERAGIGRPLVVRVTLRRRCRRYDDFSRWGTDGMDQMPA